MSAINPLVSATIKIRVPLVNIIVMGSTITLPRAGDNIPREHDATIARVLVDSLTERIAPHGNVVHTAVVKSVITVIDRTIAGGSREHIIFQQNVRRTT